MREWRFALCILLLSIKKEKRETEAAMKGQRKNGEERIVNRVNEKISVGTRTL